MHLLFRGKRVKTGFALAFFLAISTLLAQTEQIPATGAATAPAQEPILKVGGDVLTPAQLKLSDLSRMPRLDVRVKDRDGDNVTYSGVSLTEVLRAGGLKLDPSSVPTRDIVSSYILVQAADGYRAVFASAEVDPAQTDRLILLADHKNGQLLSATEGPFRIVFPGEKRPARWVRQVQSILVNRPE
jgi:hypothetical protein